MFTKISLCVVLSGSKANNNSPTKKAAEKKAAYETLLAEASPEVETVGPEESEVEPTESNTDGVMAACKFCCAQAPVAWISF